MTYDLVLIEYPGGQWSIEPIGIDGVSAGEQVVTGDLPSLVDGHARGMIASLTGHDVYDFDLRFLAPSGEVLATSVITTMPPGRHHQQGVIHERVQLHGPLAGWGQAPAASRR